MPFKAGDVVRLKSGGPPMTVFEVLDPPPVEGPMYHVEWFDGAVLQRDAFGEVELVPVSAERVSPFAGQAVTVLRNKPTLEDPA